MCIDYTRPALAIEIEKIDKSFANIKTKGIRVRVLTEITTDNISYCKRLSALVHELRHLDGIKGSFYLSEAEYLAPAIFHERGKAASQLIYTNVKELVEHQQYVFDTLWDKSIPAQEKIKEIEEGIKPQFIETIRDPFQLQKLALDIGNSARDEVLLIYSTANALYRQEKLGAIKSLIEAVKRLDLKARILTPKIELIEKTIQNLKKQLEHRNFEIRCIPESLQTQVSVLIVDRKSSLVVEIKDDNKDSSYEAMRLGTYSNSRSTVSSFVTIFETLWRQSEMYAENELANMKDYLNDVLNEIASIKKPVEEK